MIATHNELLKAVIRRRIANEVKRLAVLDDRIGRLMSERVGREEKIAALFDELNALDVAN